VCQKRSDFGSNSSVLSFVLVVVLSSVKESAGKIVLLWEFFPLACMMDVSTDNCHVICAIDV